VTLEETAALAGTIGYEILTRFGARLPRVYLEASEGLA
jgi:alanine racemase